jgi:hypothetical protein
MADQKMVPTPHFAKQTIDAFIALKTPIKGTEARIFVF